MIRYVVVCDNPEDEPTIYGTFSSRDTAEKWIADTAEEARGYDNEPCPNEHYVIMLNEVSEG